MRRRAWTPSSAMLAPTSNYWSSTRATALRPSRPSLSTPAIVVFGTSARLPAEPLPPQRRGRTKHGADHRLHRRRLSVWADWVERISTLFEREPEAALVFGKVSIPEELKGKGFAADFEPHQRAYHHHLPPAHVAWGLGANMSARRHMLERLDPSIRCWGLVRPSAAGEETDLAIRALVAGYKVVKPQKSPFFTSACGRVMKLPN